MSDGQKRVNPWDVVRRVVSWAALAALVGGFAYLGWWMMFAPAGVHSGNVVIEGAETAIDRVELAQMMPSFHQDLATLTRAPHRLAGSPEGRAAADYVEQRLRDMGLEVHVQRFGVVRAQYDGVGIQVDGGEPEPLYACRPNLLAASVTLPEGLSGRSLYAGRGRLTDYGVRNPEDCIVILDYDQGAYYWQNAFALGARAVVFVGDEQPAAQTWHHMSIPAMLPRFYMPREQAARLGLLEGSHDLTIRSRATWPTLEGRNIIARVRGTRPVFKLGQPEAILLAAPLDSYGEVPELSPGARHAANAAALLGTAEYLRQFPPARDVILCFFDAQAHSNAGARAFYGTLIRKWKNDELAKPLRDRKARLDAEETYIRDVLDLIDSPGFAAAGGGTKERAMIDLIDTARMLANDERERVQRLRQAAVDIASQVTATRGQLEQLEAPQPRAELETEAARLDRELAEAQEELAQAEQATEGWSTLQRNLNDDVIPGSPEYRATVEQLHRLRSIRLREIEREQTWLADGMALERAIGEDFIVLHVSLDFGSARRRWVITHGDQTVTGKEPLGTDQAGQYQSDIFKALRQTAEAISLAAPQALADYDVESLNRAASDLALYTPGARADSGAIARLFGVWNVAGVTAFDPRTRDGQPQDTVAALGEQADDIRAQAAQLSLLVWGVARHDGLGVARRVAPTADFAETQWKEGRVQTGPRVMMLTGSSSAADRPARGGVVAIVPATTAANWGSARITSSVPGFEQAVVVPVDGNGSYDFGPVMNKVEQFGTSNYFCSVFDYGDDPAHPAPMGVGIPRYVTNSATIERKLDDLSLQVFPCRTLALVGMGYDRATVASQPLRAESTAPFRADFSLMTEVDQVAAVFIRPAERGIKLFNRNGLAILNNTEEDEAGHGVPFESPFDFIPTIPRSAQDLWTLNEARLNLLIDNHIMEGALQKFQEQARRILIDADAAAESGTVPLAQVAGDRMASNAISRDVYPPVLAVLNDLVVAVVFLLLLAIPFAYALERLLIGTPHIYRQIGYVTALFLVTFGVLYLVNPAFRIAATPIIIFLAFAIIVLSALVIFIMVRKLREEVKRMQGLGTTVHSSDVSRLSTMMAAVNMGISTMRRRPLRTILTAVTVVLLTFTILTFASFSNTWGIRTRYIGPQSLPQRVLVRQALWGEINETILEMFRGRMMGRAHVVPRWWVAPAAAEAEALGGASAGTISAADARAERSVSMAALVGIDPLDLQRQASLARIFGLADASPEARALPDDAVYLTPQVAEQLGVQVGDEVLIHGRPFRLGGLVLPQDVMEYTEMENSSLLPVDYQSSQGGRLGAFSDEVAVAANEVPDVESAQFVNFSPDKVGFISPASARRLNGRIRAFHLYALDEEATEEQINDLGAEAAKLVRMPAYVSGPRGVYRLYFTTLTEASGFRDLVIPVVLGGLIVFATMLGSVSDREREIYTFSALGLAPPHVASLFFAEASVYAVVGGMGGYLLGQTVGRVLGWLSSLGVLEMPSMNYSSSNAIVTVLIVMGTVLISTIYPAVKASRSANPGVQRNWKIPPPKGDQYDIIFPFTVSSYDITGVVSFLKEHFDNYGDTSLGNFATERSRVFRQREHDLPAFEAAVALAPFDLGVTQHFTLLSQPSEIEGIDEVRILLERQSGSPGDWRRANRTFVTDLRRQLLIWRSLPAAVVERYRRQTLDQWDALPVGSDRAGAEVAQ